MSAGLEPPAASACDAGDHEPGCVTCGDVAAELSVLRLDAERGLALCESDSGRRETVEIGLIEDVAEGECLLVHAGTAIARAMPQAVER